MTINLKIREFVIFATSYYTFCVHPNCPNGQFRFGTKDTSVLLVSGPSDETFLI